MQAKSALTLEAKKTWMNVCGHARWIEKRCPGIFATRPAFVCLARYMCNASASMPRVVEETWLLPLIQRLYTHRDP